MQTQQTDPVQADILPSLCLQGARSGDVFEGEKTPVAPKWQVTRLPMGLGGNASHWDALNTRLFNSHPMLESRFVDSLLRHFGNGSEYLCVLASNGTPQAMCLLQQGNHGIWQTYLPSQAQVGPTLMPSPKCLQELIRSLPGFVTRLDFLCNDPAFGDLSKECYGNTTTGQNHALTMSIDLIGDFGGYWAGRSKGLIKNMARYARRLEADQLVRKFVCVTDAQAIGPAVARYAKLEGQGWKGKLGTAINLESPQGHFYSELMTRFAATGNAMVFELWLDDHLVASRLVIASAHMLIILKTTYDESFEQYAPGRQLLKAVVEHLFAHHPGKVIEFYTNASSDNLEWATGQRWIKHISIYRSSFTANMFQMLRAGRQILPLRRQPAFAQEEALNMCVYQHPDEFSADVQRLFDTKKQENVEFSAEWYRNLVNTVYPNQRGVRIYVLQRDGRAVAALPVCIMKSASGQHLVALSNYYTSIYAPLTEPELRARELAWLLNAIKATQAPLVSVRFDPLDPESDCYNILQEALQLSGFATFQFFCFGNWYLRHPQDWPQYLLSREGKLRNTLKRMGKKLCAHGRTLELITDGTDLVRGLAAYQQVYALSWKKPEPHPDFIAGLMRICAEKNWLRLGVAWLNGVPIAAQLWIVSNGKADIYKLAYDNRHKSFASGTLLTAMLLHHAITVDKVTEVDYLSGDDPYKKSWMTHRRERWGIIAYNPETLGGFMGMLKEIAGRALRPMITHRDQTKAT